jgi:MFS transporter, putative metabolite:H+ symporter
MIWATLSKFFLSMSFIFSLNLFVKFIVIRFQYTAEVYPTKIRTTGVGMANGVGRFGGVVMPWICMYMAGVDLLSPFLLFAMIAVITSISNFFLPYDTMGKELEE